MFEIEFNDLFWNWTENKCEGEWRSEWGFVERKGGGPGTDDGDPQRSLEALSHEGTTGTPEDARTANGMWWWVSAGMWIFKQCNAATEEFQVFFPEKCKSKLIFFLRKMGEFTTTYFDAAKFSPCIANENNSKQVSFHLYSKNFATAKMINDSHKTHRIVFQNNTTVNFVN